VGGGFVLLRKNKVVFGKKDCEVGLGDESDWGSLTQGYESTRPFRTFYYFTQYSQSSTSATVTASGGVGGNGSHILDSADLETVTGQGSDGGLGTGAGGLGFNTAETAHLNVDSVNADRLEGLHDINSSEHSSVRG